MKNIQILICLLCMSLQNIAQTDALTIVPNGNVGVGTTTPTQKLDVQGAVHVSEDIIIDTGNLGIGTTTPSEKLEIKGDVFTNGANLWLTGRGDHAPKRLRLHHSGSAAYMDWKSGHLNFRNDTSTKMTITQDGNIGIGIDNPNAKLHIRSNASDPAITANNALTINSSNSNDGSLQIGIDKGYSWIQSHGGKPLAINVYNNVGIGTSTPTQGKLVVNGVGNLQNVRYGYLNNRPNNTTGVYSGGVHYSIYATGRIASTEFNAYSDLRIKNVIGLSNTSNDLETLSKIKITDYTLIDTVTKGNQTHKKIIAQQLKEIYPQAVTDDITEMIPNIYQLSKITNGWITIAPKDLVIGDTIKLIFSHEEVLVAVLEIKENAIKVASNKEGDVFVYGKQVSDFHTVDYEDNAMLNVSATQALLKQIKTL